MLNIKALKVSLECVTLSVPTVSLGLIYHTPHACNSIIFSNNICTTHNKQNSLSHSV